MFPRRAVVQRVLLYFCCCVLAFTYLTSPAWQNLYDGWETLGVNENEARYVKTLRSQIPVNPHNFRYILNAEDVCSKKKIFLITYIHTDPIHYRRRAAIRETWASPHLFDDMNTRIVFLMGLPSNDSVQEALNMESDLYGDIVQEDFVDSYRNLTYKAIMGLKWVSTYCSNAKYVLKADDDIFVNIFNVVTHLKSIVKLHDAPPNMILCMEWTRMKVVRDPKSKWYIPRSEFYSEYFPRYCSGSGFVMDGNITKAMYDASLTTPFFWVDDYYVTGLLAEKVGATRKRLNSVYHVNHRTFYEKFNASGYRWRTLTFGHVHNLDWWFEIWNTVLKERKMQGLV